MRYIPSNITRELITRLYIEERKSCLQIGKIINKSAKQVSRYLKRFEIEVRPFSSFNFQKGSKPRLGVILSEETKDKIRQSHIGKRIPVDVRVRMGSKGNKNAGWIDGRTPRNRKIRHSVEYKLFVEAVFRRDKWTCQKCSKVGGDIHAHHVKPFAKYPELRTSIENGLTLCVKCHKDIHKSNIIS